ELSAPWEKRETRPDGRVGSRREAAGGVTRVSRHRYAAKVEARTKSSRPSRRRFPPWKRLRPNSRGAGKQVAWSLVRRAGSACRTPRLYPIHRLCVRLA